MKSKMKSTFAIIAVALMVLVAVVPMIGVFTGESDAAKVVVSDPSTVADPNSGKSTIIEVTVNAYEADGSTKATGDVKIAYGSYSQIGTLNNGSITFKIYESEVSSLVITKVDSKGVQDTDYPNVPMSNLVKGEKYTATLMAGHLVGTLSFNFANTTGIMTETILGKKATSGSYAIYNGDAETASETGTLTMYYATGGNLEGTFLYPAGLASAKIAVTNFSGVTGITFDSAAKYAIVTSSAKGTATAIANQDLVTITSASTMVYGKVKVDAFTVYYMEQPTGGTATEKYVTYSPLDDEIEGASKSAYFVGTKPVSTTTVTVSNVKYTMKVSADGGSMTTDKAVYATSIGGYVPTKAFFGQVYMVNAKNAQAGTITATIADTTTSTFSASAKVDANGYFLKFYDKTIATGAGQVTEIKFDNYAIANKTGYSGSTNLDMKILADKSDNGYADMAIVGGTLALQATSDVPIKSKAITITGAGITTFGSLLTDGSTTASNNGKFEFYATKGVSATLGVDGAAVSGATSIVVGTSSADVGKLYMATQTATITVQDALGAPISTGVSIFLVSADKVAIEKIGDFAESEIPGEKGVYKAEVRGDVNLGNDAYVYFNVTGHKFVPEDTKTMVKYSTTPFKATTATYTFQMLKSNGKTAIYDGTTASNVASLYVASAYKNSAGAIIYEYDNDTTSGTGITLTAGAKYPSTSASANAYTFIADATIMAKSSSDITITPAKFVIAIPGATATGSNIFDPQCVLTAADGVVLVKAGKDSLSGTLTKLDGVTPIPGITATLTVSGTTTKTAVTQSDGSFSFTTDQLLTYDGSKINFTNANGYTFTADQKVIKSDKDSTKITEFTSATETYTMTFVDADGEKITAFVNSTGPEITATKVNVAGTTVPDNGSFVQNSIVGNTAKYTASWTTGTSALTIADIAGDGKASFAKHTLTADELSTGKITLVSNQSTYTFKSVDANGKGIDGIQATLYKYDGDQPAATGATIPATAGTPATGYKATVRLPYYADEADTEYCFKVTNTNKYKFEDVYTYIDSTSVVMESLTAKIVYILKDADGLDLDFTGGTATYGVATVYKDGATTGTDVAYTAGTGYVFYDEPSSTYTVSVANVTNVNNDVTLWTYTFAKKQVAEDGVLFAEEEWVVGDVVDATGFSIGDAGNTVVTSYIGKTAGNTAKYAAATSGSYYKILVDVDAVTEYRITAGKPANYTFETSESPIIVANEQTVIFSAVTANGYDLVASFTNPKAFDSNGMIIGTGFETLEADGVIVDVKEVAYYKAEVAVIGDLAGELNFSGISFDGEFVANESYITGSVPYSGKGTQKATIELYLEGNLVKELPAEVVNKTEYVAYVDLTGYIGETAGVVFDSILVVYYENNVEIATAAVDPYSTVNNIVSPTVQVYVAVLDAPSALIARHVSIAQVGNTATVSADGQFIVADDDAIYTDGQYIYTFAGWYVDNEKVSSAPSFTFSLTENVVIVPEYTVKYEKISDANAQVDPEIIIEEITKENTGIDTNVLIIGIAAVIVALIAVVYAVIKKE